jgi:hypothetical protein
MPDYVFVRYDEDGREVRLASGETRAMGDTYDPGDTVILTGDDGVEKVWKVARTIGTKIVVEKPGD